VLTAAVTVAGLLPGTPGAVAATAETPGAEVAKAAETDPGADAPQEVVIPAAPRAQTVFAGLFRSQQSNAGWVDSAGSDGVFHTLDDPAHLVWTRYADGSSTTVALEPGTSVYTRGTGSDTLATVKAGQVVFHGADGTTRTLTVPANLTAPAVFGTTVVAQQAQTQPDGTPAAPQTHLLSLRADGTPQDVPLTAPDGLELSAVVGGDPADLVMSTPPRDGLRRLAVASTATGRVEAVTAPVPETYSRVKLSPKYLVLYSRDEPGRGILVFRRDDLSAPLAKTTEDAPVWTGTNNRQFAVVGDWLVFDDHLDLEAMPLTGGPAVTLLPRTDGRVATAPDGTAVVIGGSDPVDWGVRHVTADASGRPVVTTVKRLPNPARIQGIALGQGRLDVVDDSSTSLLYQYVRDVGFSGPLTYGRRTRLSDVPEEKCAADDTACAELRALGDGRFGRSYSGSGYRLKGTQLLEPQPVGPGHVTDIGHRYLVHAPAEADGSLRVYALGRQLLLRTVPGAAAALWDSWLWTPGTAPGTVTAEDLTTGKPVETAATGAPCVPRELQAVGRWVYWTCGAAGPAGVYDRQARTSQPVPAGDALLGDGYVVTHDAAAGHLVLTGADTAHPVSRVIGDLPATGVSQRHIRWTVDRFGGHVAYADAEERVHVVPTGIATQPLTVLDRTAVAKVTADERATPLLGVLTSKPAGAWTITARHATTGQDYDLASGTESRGWLRFAWTGKDASGQLMPNGAYTWTLTAAPADGHGPALTQTGSVVLTGGRSPATQRLTTVEPERVMDTRGGVGVRKGKVGSGATVTLKVTGYTNVTAVAMNVTATNATASTYISVYPAGTARSAASNVNVPAGRTVPNMVVVPVKDGKVTFYNHAGTVDLVADLTGLYTTESGSLYEPVRPARLLDTRSGLGARRAKVPAHTTVPLTVTGRGGVPSQGVTAVVLNLTATNATHATVVSVVPDAWTVDWWGPSALNVPAGQTVSNLVLAPVRDGRINLYNNAGATDLVADVAGYFTDGDLGSLYQPLAPARAMDTRYGTGVRKGAVGPGGTVTLQVAGTGGVPATGVTAVVLNVTATNPTASTYVAAYPSGTPRSSASNLNPRPGQTVAGLVVVPVTDGKVTFYNHAGTVDLVADVEGFYAP
jgi:hypothetical protein